MDKIELIKQAIENGSKRVSKLPAEQYNVPALTSLNIRHILNNIGALGTIHLECGVHKAGTYTATIAGNNNLISTTAIDSFESDERNEDKAMPQFLANAQRFMPEGTNYQFVLSDTFESFDKIESAGIDLYMYDGDHSEESQRKALTYFKDKLADEFIFLCDDYDWPEVKKGTQDGIKEAGYEVLYDHILVGNNHDNDGFWNGFYIALLKKPAAKIKKAKSKKK